MKQVHELKIWPQFYSRVASGQKTFEIRNNDRNYQSGDKVILKEWDPNPINPEFATPVGFTGSPPLEFVVGYVHFLGRDEVVFSLLPIPQAKEPSKGEAKTKKPKDT